MLSEHQMNLRLFQNTLRRTPNARAMMNGSRDYPDLHGFVSFYQTSDGVFLIAQIHGLPTGTQACSPDIYGFHIHEGKSCTGNAEDPFADTDGHYNPNGCPHPAHAGDLPPLFGNRGYAFMAFFTDRFTVNEVIGRTVIIHAAPDDFTTQPSGNSGAKIACGKIMPTGILYR
ncbi:superoxide dismutase family protein [Caproicibacter sp.]|uniref:superoxide dismutase family protein n=1 Tax=Caproicibacter sp. TaxID=2814884 RepID=UPI003989BFDB